MTQHAIPPPAVSVAIVTHDSATDLPACFAALAAQDFHDFEVVAVDCASADDSVEAARTLELGGAVRKVVALSDNRGFAGGMNEALRHAAAPHVLALNPDARLRPDCLRRLHGRAASPPAGLRLAAVTPRLVRPAEGVEPRRLDACGMVLVRAWRHLDRGSGELDRGQYGEPERVFGATGAVVLYARRALDDVALGGEVFDAAFHTFREDAELCFRFQERGWEVLYEPAAVAEHRRTVVPGRRRLLPAAYNYHSLKNRYLLRAYHQTAANFWRTLAPALARDLLALVYVLARERTSLAAYGWLWRHRREIRDRRRRIRARRTAPASAVERWFSRQALPLERE
jgi:GT2 family glycosyltransferase